MAKIGAKKAKKKIGVKNYFDCQARPFYLYQ